MQSPPGRTHESLRVTPSLLRKATLVSQEVMPVAADWEPRGCAVSYPWSGLGSRPASGTPAPRLTPARKPQVRAVALPRLPPGSRGQVSGLSPRTTKPSGRSFVRSGSATQTGQGAGSPDAPAAPPEGVGSELMGVFVPSTTDAGNKPGDGPTRGGVLRSRPTSPERAHFSGGRIV